MPHFIETPGFSANLDRFMDDDSYASFQSRLIAQPRSGPAIPGCGGMRKIRIPDPRRQKGKRGGARVVYLHVPLIDWFLLVAIYGKDRKEDLSAEEKNELRELSRLFSEEALRSAGVRQ
jgi:hypothetical protein